MKFKPYDWQQATIDDCVAFLSGSSAGARKLYAAPTGCGKSIIELSVQAALPSCWIVTPRDEIIAGMMDKLGVPDEDPMQHRICTPVKLRNRMLNGTLWERPKYILFDEAHHHEANTWQEVTLLSGLAPSAAFTASPYRGSPRSTRKFLEHWGDPHWVLTFAQAVAKGVIRRPSFHVLPLVDDDVIEVSGGDFAIESIESATLDRLGDLAEQSKQWYADGRWTRPTVFACPSGAVCRRLQEELGRRGLPAAIVAASTRRDERKPIFDATVQRLVALLHINIVSEGVDLPLRRLVDLAPTMSPVKWVQQLGRITRPTQEEPPEYVCTNRNILRHAYALQGEVPMSAVVETERAFGPTKRAHVRVLGLEALGRFASSTAKMLNGATLHTYKLAVVPIDGIVVFFAVLVPPTHDPIWASRIDTVENGKRVYGKWNRCNPPADLQGFASKGSSEPTEKQRAWWNRSAARFGLDPYQELNRRSFEALPVLNDLGVKLCLQ